MPLYYSMLQLTPSMCLRLLCLLLLLIDSSYTVSAKEPVFVSTPLTSVNTPQVNCSTECNNNNTAVGQDSKAKDFSTTRSSGMTTNLQQKTSIPNLISSKPSVPVISTKSTFVEKQKKKTVLSKVNSKSTQQVQSSPDSSSSVHHTTASYALRNSLTTPLPPKQSAARPHSSTASTSNTSPERVRQPTSVLPSRTTGLPTQSAHTGSITSTGTVTTPAQSSLDANTVAVPVASTSTTKPLSTVTTETAPTSRTTTEPSHSLKETANTTTAISANTGRHQVMSTSTSGATQHLSTGMPLSKITSLTPNASSVTTTSTVTSTKHLTSATRVAMVEVAGGALTTQLVDTSSLLAVLLFGLLFLLVTVAVLVKQVYESYRRKDYTQVDYLINGMYTDSGV